MVRRPRLWLHSLLETIWWFLTFVDTYLMYLMYVILIWYSFVQGWCSPYLIDGCMTHLLHFMVSIYVAIAVFSPYLIHLIAYLYFCDMGCWDMGCCVYNDYNMGCCVWYIDNMRCYVLLLLLYSYAYYGLTDVYIFRRWRQDDNLSQCLLLRTNYSKSLLLLLLNMLPLKEEWVEATPATRAITTIHRMGALTNNSWTVSQ